MSACDAELCPYWTGQGCACEVLGIAAKTAAAEAERERGDEEEGSHA